MSHYFAQFDASTKRTIPTEFAQVKHVVYSGWPRSIVVASTFLLLTGFLAPTSWAQTPETLRHFDEGNTLYSEGRYQDAITAFEKAVASGYSSADLFYNLGNAYYRIDELASAMLNYKRAEKLAPEKPELKHSIQLTNGRLIDRFSRLPEPFWISVSQKFYSAKTVKPFTLLGLFMYVVGIFLIAYRMWLSTDNAWIRRAYSALLFIGIPLLAGGLLTSYKTANIQGAVVMVNQTGLFEEPADDTQISSKTSDLQIHAGLVVKLQNSVENWSQVVLPNGVSGWVQSDTIETI